MPANFRQFEAKDLFGRTWNVEFLWLQNGISIRHADTVDIKFELASGDTRISKVIALNHPDLIELSKKTGRPVTDVWCSRLAALHLEKMLATGEDLGKTLVTPTFEMLQELQRLAR
jgi:hypothetical protein